MAWDHTTRSDTSPQAQKLQLNSSNSCCGPWLKQVENSRGFAELAAMRALEARPMPLGRVGELRRPRLRRVFDPQTPRLCCGGRRLCLGAVQQVFSACQVRGPQP